MVPKHLIVLLALTASGASAFVASGAFPAARPVAATAVIMLSPTALDEAASSEIVGTQQQSLARRVVSLPFKPVRALWRRCTDDSCDVGRPRPIAFLKSLIPKQRPLHAAINRECSEGIYKVERRDVDGKKQRVMVLYPLKVQQQCTVEDAMDMF